MASLPYIDTVTKYVRSHAKSGQKKAPLKKEALFKIIRNKRK